LGTQGQLPESDVEGSSHASWRDVLDELEGSIEKVAAKGADVLKLAIRPPWLALNMLR